MHAPEVHLRLLPKPVSLSATSSPPKELRQFDDELLLSARYNVGSTKTHIAKYLVDFVAKDVVKAAYRFQKQRDQQYFTKNKTNMIRDHLRYAKGYDITLKMVNSILSQVQRAVFVGTLPHSAKAIEEEDSGVEQKDKELFRKNHKDNGPSSKLLKT